MTQRGFTLIEVLVVMAISGVVLLSIVWGIQMVIFGTARSNSQVVALDEVNRASLRIKRDLSTYNDVNLTVEPPDLITINWTDQTFELNKGPREYEVTYSLSGTELLRIYTKDDSPTPTQIIGRHITYLSFARNEVNDRFIDVVITTTICGMAPRSETVRFSVYQLKEVPAE